MVYPDAENKRFNAEYPMIRWLEANGYDVTYFAGVDSDRRGLAIRSHKVFLSAGHDEYWSAAQRANVEAARDAGVSLAGKKGRCACVGSLLLLAAPVAAAAALSAAGAAPLVPARGLCLVRDQG